MATAEDVGRSVHGRVNYAYDEFWENSHRVTYARNLSDPSLSRSYDYDHVGRLRYAHTGVEARMHAFNQPHDTGLYGPYAHHYHYDVFGNLTQRHGWGGENPSYTASYTDNRRDGFGYDPAGSVTWDGEQSFAYDAEGQQTYASGTALTQHYDGERLRVKKVEQGAATYYLRSTALGGQVIAEMLPWQGGWGWSRGYVYMRGQLLAMQQGGVQWVEQDPVVKSQRLTNASGDRQAWLEMDAWGGQTTDHSSGGETWLQPRKYTSYERDANASDEAMQRRYNRRWSRFDQPDPSDGSYNLADPQSFNRYAYVSNDPINFVDPSGLNEEGSGSRVTDWYIDQMYRNLLGWQAMGGRGGLEFSGETVGSENPQKSLPPPSPCEQRLGAMFGGRGATMRTTYDVDGQYRGRDDLAALIGTARHNRSTPDYDSIWDSEHLNNSPHLLGNLEGTVTTDIYVPGNYQGGPTSPSPTAGVVLINYAQFGSLTNVTLAVFHVGDFGVRRNGDRVRIGSTGGPGGGQGGTRNLHAHFEIWRGEHTSVLGTAQRYAARIPFDLAGLCP